MCGIAGIWSSRHDAGTVRASLERMIGTLRHRGPDGFGYHEAPGIGLAHARLSIIDLETGGQPIGNEDGTVWVVCNGEIFNYLELRAALIARGHRFRTQSDTEVLVHLYEERGADFVDELNGQFAIALWDARERRLLLARDRVGVRPLYVAEVAGGLLFGSEVKALLAEGSVRPRLDARSLGQVFTFWAPLPGQSVFEGIESLAPGTMLIADDRGIRRRRYWQWDFAAEPVDRSRSRESYAEELRWLLRDAVRLQLRSDVPVGTYLSGGLDSSAITTIVQEQRPAPVTAFSMRFADAEFDEGRYQQLVADRLGIRPVAVAISAADIAAGFRRAIWHAESPVLRTAPVPLMLLAGRVRESGYKVVLTGEGADEVFAGYDLFREAKVRRWIADHAGSRWRSRLLERLYPYLRHSPVQGRAFSAGFFNQGAEFRHRVGFSHLPRWDTTRRSWQFFSPELRAQLGTAAPLDDIETVLPPGIDTWPELGQDQFLEAQTLLSGYLLSSQGDRMSMAHSVEGRVPFLDHRLMEFSARLPPRVKLRGLHEKQVLKDAMQGLLPPEVVRRPKQPYRAPDVAAFVLDGRLRDEAAELLDPARLREAGYFDVPAVARLIEKCIAGRAIGFSDNMSFVGILSTMALHEAFVSGRSTA